MKKSYFAAKLTKNRNNSFFFRFFVVKLDF